MIVSVVLPPVIPLYIIGVFSLYLAHKNIQNFLFSTTSFLHVLKILSNNQTFEKTLLLYI